MTWSDAMGLCAGRFLVDVDHVSAAVLAEVVTFSYRTDARNFERVVQENQKLADSAEIQRRKRDAASASLGGALR